MFFEVTVSYVPVVVLKYHDQRQIVEEFIPAHDSR